MDTPITRAEHEEFRRRIEEHDKRQDKRLDLLEEGVQQNRNLAVSVEKLAVSMENMTNVQKEQGEKLDKLEGRDGEMWRKVVGYIATTIVGIVVGFLFRQIGL